MHLPGPTLPIDAVLPDLLAALAAGPFAVLVAAPGAGKTTRVPLALLDTPWRQDGRIIVLEPRRLAARAAARRMAQTLGEAVGETVGFRVRLETKIGPRTRIEVVTEGVFTRMLLDDAALTGVAAVLFDEFHERSLDADLGLALALDATALNPDLRLLVMSATIDAAAVAKLMGNAPVVISEGRAFPVETRYRPPATPTTRLEDHVAAVVREALANDPGSVLVFLPGEGEIHRTAERLADRLPADVELAPLYGQLPPAEQDRAIAPAAPGRRKLVLATTIAQTSLTIEGVRIVIDGGLSRGPSYEPATGLTSLATRRVSLAAAEQRRGRAGRIEPGICYRLWSEAQEGAFAAFDRPEMLEADLAPLALDLAAWGVANPGALAFLDPPPTAAWREAVALLGELEAIDATGRITAAGSALARLPLHPRLGHMVRAAAANGEARLAAEIAVLLGERGLGGTEIDLDARLARFRHDRSPRAADAHTLARRWAALVGGDRGASAGSAGPHLALAYPDRVAAASGRPGRFRLANGRAAELSPTEALARAPFLVVTDITGSAANGQIRAAATIERAEIETIFAARITEATVRRYDPTAAAVRARRVRSLGALALADAPVAVPRDEATAHLLATGIAAAGLAALPWTSGQLARRERASFLHASLGAPWPDLGDVALGAGVETWLTPSLIGRAALAEITADDLEAALEPLLPWALRHEMETLLPSHFDAPSGQRHPIDYGAENGPALAIRVQELFGLDRHPAIAGGKIPLLLVLLSPARRPIQTTRDLPGFWRGSWRDVVRELRGRYPRHPWPDDPLAAPATHRAKPRGT